MIGGIPNMLMAMDPTLIDSVTAISSLIINAIGITMAVISLKIWREKKSTPILLSSILFFTIPAPWLVDFIVYVTHLVSGDTPSNSVLVIFSAWSIPILSTFWVYITSELYSKEYPRLKWIMLGILGVLDIIFYTVVFILDQWIVSDITDSILIKIDYGDIGNIMVVLYGLFGLLFIFPSYTYFSMKSENQLFKVRSALIASGTLLFTISGVLDAVLVFGSITLIVVLRFLIVAALTSLYLGFITPNFLRERYQS